jgi:serine phosphatase RsbU (regulator of sigma subunit)
VFVLLVKLGMKVGLFTIEEDNLTYRNDKFLFFPLLRNRIWKLFFGLVAISGSITVGTPLLIWQLQHFGVGKYVKQYLFGFNLGGILVFPFGYSLGGILFFPFIAFIAIILAMILQPLVNWIRSSSKTRPFIFATAVLAALVSFYFVIWYQPAILPGYKFVRTADFYDWFMALRGPRIPLENDLVVIDASTDNPWDIIKLCAASNPRKMVIIPDTVLKSENALTRIDAITGLKSKILISSFFIESFQQKFPHLQFAPMYYEIYYYGPSDHFIALNGENDSLTVPFFLARERNPLMNITKYISQANEYGNLMIDSYSKWGSFVPRLEIHENATGWQVTYWPLHSTYSEYFIAKSVVPPEKTAGASIFDSLRNKTVILDFLTRSTRYDWQTGSYGRKIAAVLMNIEQDDFIYRVPLRGVTALALVVLIVNLLCYYRFKPWPAIGTAIVLNSLFFAGTLLLYAEWSIIFYLLPIMYSISVFTLIVFPYELIRERSIHLEERTRLETELKAAHDMQLGLMPLENPNVSGYDIAGLCLPANEVGGDFYDYVWLNEEKTRLGIAIADVSGKAMKAAMTAVMTSGMIYTEAGSCESPKTILRKINRPMYFKTDRQVFTAMSFAMIDIKKKELTFSNAGQMTPLLRRNDALQSIKVEGPRLPLGVREVVEYNEVTVQLKNGDILVLFTDGLVEAKNNKNELWGFERMEQAVKSLSSEISAQQMAEGLIAEANRFAGTAMQQDDMTIVVVRVL